MRPKAHTLHLRIHSTTSTEENNNAGSRIFNISDHKASFDDANPSVLNLGYPPA